MYTFPLFTVTKDEILRRLYETLEKVQYPDLAQTRIKDFENYILAGNKRIKLLGWILQNIPDFHNLTMNKLKIININEKPKIVNYYSQIGLCNEEDVLLGHCPIGRQLYFLQLLTSFIKNVYFTTESPNNILEANVEIMVNSVSIEKDKCGIINQDNVNYIKKNELSNALIGSDESSIEKTELDNLLTNVEHLRSALNDIKAQDCESIIEKFNICFKTISSSQSHDLSDNKLSTYYSNLLTTIENTYSTFMIFNKALESQNKIMNQASLEEPVKTIEYLTEAIKDNLVLVEQACNSFKDSY